MNNVNVDLIKEQIADTEKLLASTEEELKDRPDDRLIQFLVEQDRCLLEGLKKELKEAEKASKYYYSVRWGKWKQ